MAIPSSHRIVAMRFTRLLLHPILLIQIIFATSSTAVLVAPGSTCSVSCGNVLSATSPDDITCTDSAYSTNSAGQVFQSCVSCEVSSTYVEDSTNTTDLQALLYNLRYTASTCLWGFPNDTGLTLTSNPCVTGFACGSLEASIKYGNLTSDSNPYGYCSSWDETLVPRCEACLQALGDQNYMSNYIIALDAACSQRPAAGSTLSLQGSLFSSAAVVITTPTPSSEASFNYNPDSGPLTLGAKVGISVGAIIFCLIAAGCFIVCRGKRRRRAHLKQLAAGSLHGLDMSDRYGDRKDPSFTPQSNNSRVFMAPQSYAWQAYSHQNESPVSSMGEPTYFSPYSSNYCSPVSPQVGRQLQGQPPLSKSANEKGKGVWTETVPQPDEFEMSNLPEHKNEQWVNETAQTGFAPASAPNIRHTVSRERESVGSLDQAP